MVSSHQVPVVADVLFEDLQKDEVEMIVLPGGLPGATNLDAHAGLDKLVMEFAAAGKPLAAICAAPMVYGKRGLLKGKKATCYPGFDKYLEGAVYTGNMVERQIISSWAKARLPLLNSALLFWNILPVQKRYRK